MEIFFSILFSEHHKQNSPHLNYIGVEAAISEADISKCQQIKLKLSMWMDHSKRYILYSNAVCLI